MFLERYNYFLIGLLLLIAGDLYASTTYLNISLGNQEIKGLQILKDSNEVLDITQIASPDYSNRFKPVSSDGSDFIDTAGAIWLRLSLENNGSRDNQWLIEFDGWSEVNFYFKDSLNNFEEKVTGILVPFKKRDYPFANRALINLPIHSGKELLCFVRLKGYHVKLFGTSSHKFYANPKVLMESDLYDFKRIFFLFFGVFLALLLYETFMIAISKNTKYVYYLLMLFFILVLIGTNSGYIVSVFSFIESLPIAVHFIRTIGVTGLAISTLKFFTTVFETKENHQLLYTLSKWLTISIGINFLLLLLLQNVGMVIFTILLGLMSLVIISISINGIKDGNPYSWFYLTAYLSLLIGVLVDFIAHPSDAYLITVSSNPIFFTASAFEMILISFGLANQVNLLVKENRKSQEKVIEHLKANEKLLSQVNQELEQKVEKGTREINKQKDHILDQKNNLEIEQEKTERFLLNILPQETAQELKTKGYATPSYYESVSVLFTNFLNFSTIARELDAEELVMELDYIFSGFDDITKRNNIEKIKTIGDVYLGVGGIPVSNKSHSLDTVKTAIEMRAFMDQLNVTKKKEGKIIWILRVGIHSGPVTAGVVGNIKFAYDIWGDTVNSASRMATNAEGGMINLSEETYNEVKDTYNLTYRGKIDAKNKGEIDMYFVN